MTDLSSIFAQGLRKPTMAELLMKQSISTAPAQGGWGEGLARALMGGMAGYMEKQDADTEGKNFDTMTGLKPGASQPMLSAPTSQAAPDPKALGAALAQGGASKIYSQDERNPLDPPLPQDRDLMIRTLHAEAGNQGPEGQRAAASVIRNRTVNGGYGGDTVSGVIRAPNQFEAVNTPAGQQRMASLPAGSNQYNAIGKTVDEAYAGNDPTNGAVNFINPRLQADLDRKMPAWAQGPGQDIGDHRFFGGQGDPGALPPNAQFAQGGPVPAAQPQGPQQRQAPQIPPDVLTRARAMWTSGDPTQKASAMALIQPYLAPKDQYRPVTDPAERSRFGISPDDKNAYQVGTDNQIKPINPQPFAVNVNNQNQSAFEKDYGEGMSKRALGVIDAGDKGSEQYQRVQMLRGLNNAISTGTLTPAQSTIGGLMQSIGLNPKSLGIDPNLPANAQTMQALSNEMVTGKLGAGGFPSQNFSNTDRTFLEKTVPSLTDRPEANEMKLAVAERMAQLHVDKADKWAEARANGKSYEVFEREWRKDLQGRNVFGDLIQKIPGGQPSPVAATAAPAPTVIDGYTIKRVK